MAASFVRRLMFCRNFLILQNLLILSAKAKFTGLEFVSTQGGTWKITVKLFKTALHKVFGGVRRNFGGVRRRSTLFNYKLLRQIP